jgi:hypothetical protein
MLAHRAALEAKASALEELRAARAQHAHELTQCEAAGRAHTLADDELVEAPVDGLGGPVDEQQLWLRRRAAELRTRRELGARIASLRADVAAARTRRQALGEELELATPELGRLFGAAGSLDSYLSVSEPGGSEPADARAHLLVPPLWALHAQAVELMAADARGDAPMPTGAGSVTLYSLTICAAAPAPADGRLAASPLRLRFELLLARRRVALDVDYFPALHVLAVAPAAGDAQAAECALLLAAVDPADDGSTFPHTRALLAASRGARRGRAARAFHSSPRAPAQRSRNSRVSCPNPSACASPARRRSSAARERAAARRAFPLGAEPRRHSARPTRLARRQRRHRRAGGGGRTGAPQPRADPAGHRSGCQLNTAERAYWRAARSRDFN